MDETEDESYAAFLAERREEILQRIAEAAARAGRDPSEVELLAVSKTVDVPQVNLAWKAGYLAFGENRPQELVRKLKGLAAYPQMDGARFDMIGHLQTNKVREVVGNVTLIQSVSSLHLAEAISKRGVSHDVTSDVLLEVNVSGEESKSGFSPDEVRAALDDILALPALRVRGLMTMAPQGDKAVAHACFEDLARLHARLRDGLDAQRADAFDELSMGMSEDWQEAVFAGATIVRIGRAVFDDAFDEADR